MFNIAFHEPLIPPNTGNAIRLAAVTGSHLHLVEPLGFDLSDAKLRRAGLDYHDLARVTVHANLDELWGALAPAHTYAFTARAERRFTDVAYEPGDLLLFGRETTGLDAEVLDDPRITDRVRIPMRPGVRSLNLSNSAAVATFEALRQHDFDGRE